MKYTIEGFDQANMVELGMDCTDAVLLRWFVDFRDTDAMDRIVVKDAPNYWIKHEYVAEQLPILGITNTRNIGRRFAKLVEAGVLTQHIAHVKDGIGGKFTYYGIGPSYARLVGATGGLGTQKYLGKVLKSTIKDSSISDSSSREEQTPPLDYSQVEEWADDKHVDADPQSLKAMSELHPDRHVIEQAFKAWLSREKGARVKLHYFVKQAQPFIASELQELREYEKMLHDAENRRRAADTEREKHAKELAEIAECEKLEAEGVPLAEICKLYPDYTSILRFRQLCETMKGGAA